MMAMNALTLYRLANALHRRHIPLLPRLIQKLNFTLTRCVIPYDCKIGKSELAYGGIATVIHHWAVIGDNVMVGPCVTIGGRSGHIDVPVIEDDVQIGSGAQILGPIRIGKAAIIGAGSVVIHDVAPYSTVAGVPAKRITRVKPALMDTLLVHS